MGYILHIGVFVGIYTILALSLSIPERAGILSLCQATFYGIGAYTSAIMSARLGGSNALVGMVGGVVLAVVASQIISSASARLRDDQLIISTLFFQLVFFHALNNFEAVTNGPFGITGVGSLFPREVDHDLSHFLTVAIMCAILLLSFRRIDNSGVGRIATAIRESESFIVAHGKNTARFKAKALCLSAAASAVAGSIYAHYTGYVDPKSFGIMESILILSATIIGSRHGVLGIFLGSAFVVVIPEACRFLGLPSWVSASARQIVYGALLSVAVAARFSALKNWLRVMARDLAQ